MRFIKNGKVKTFSGARLFAAPEALKGNFDGRLNDIWLVINYIYIYIYIFKYLVNIYWIINKNFNYFLFLIIFYRAAGVVFYLLLFGINKNLEFDNEEYHSLLLIPNSINNGIFEINKN